MLRSITLILFLLAYESYCYQTHYYWKDYTGKIPDDAFIAGHDQNNENNYVGLVYLGVEGIIPATITPGEKNTYAAASELMKSQNYIQVGTRTIKDILTGQEYTKKPLGPPKKTDRILDYNFLKYLQRQIWKYDSTNEYFTSQMLQRLLKYILCTQNPESLKWIPANKTDFHFITMHKHLVRGGIQNLNWLHIGRINHQGSLIVGKILSGRAPINDAFMSYVYNEDVKKANSYETLTIVNLEEDIELIEPK